MKCLCCDDTEVQFSALCNECKDSVDDYAMIKHNGNVIVLYRIWNSLFLKSTAPNKEDREVFINKAFKLRTHEVLRIANLIWNGLANEELQLESSIKLSKINYSNFNVWKDEK